MKYSVFISLLIFTACTSNDHTDRLDLLFSGKLKIVDLTHSIASDIPFWPNPNGNPFKHKILAAHPSGKAIMASYSIPEHFATHIDAPIHGGDSLKTVDELTGSDLFGPLVVIDVEKKCIDNPDYLLSKQDLLDWEEKHNLIPEGAIVLMFTGWSKKWPDQKKYSNQDSVKKMHFPGFSPESAQFLIQNRNIHGIGIDNFSVDAAISNGFPAHKIVNGSNKFHLENVANVHELPEAGAYLIVAPIKIKGGSGGQVRLFAVIP